MRKIPIILSFTRVLCFLTLLAAGTMTGVASGQGSPQTAPAGTPSGEKARPEACAEGRSLGPIRIQIGAVEALVYVGKTVAIPVLVKGVCDLGGFSFWMSYDRSVVQLVDVAKTPFLAGVPPVDFEFTGLQPGAPRQTIKGSRPPESGGVDGRGILARLVFRGLAEGNTRINLVRLHLHYPRGEEIASFQVPVRLTVLPVSVQPGDPRDSHR